MTYKTNELFHMHGSKTDDKPQHSTARLLHSDETKQVGGGANISSSSSGGATKSSPPTGKISSRGPSAGIN